jgi:hypothetical protein
VRGEVVLASATPRGQAVGERVSNRTLVIVSLIVIVALYVSDDHPRTRPHQPLISLTFFCR